MAENGGGNGVSLNRDFGVANERSSLILRQCSEQKLVKGLRGFSPPPFLLKTFEMVENPETSHLISWSPDGNSFVIVDHNKFAAELLPKHFRHSNLASFIYQLNNYGFRKISPEKHEYENMYFQKGKKHLLMSIKSRTQQFKSLKQQVAVRPSLESEKFPSEREIESLRSGQDGLREEIQRMRELQKAMWNQFATIKESMGTNQEGSIISVFIQQFIQHLKEKQQQIGSPKNSKKRPLAEMEDTGSAEEEETSDERLTKEKQVQEEATANESEVEKLSPLEEPGISVQEDNANASSRDAENIAFWKRIMEDDSEPENGRELALMQHPAIVLAEWDADVGSKMAMQDEYM